MRPQNWFGCSGRRLACLSGEARDDGRPDPSAVLSYAWSQIPGSAPAVFGTPNALTTTVTMSVTDSYTFQLTVSDGPMSATATRAATLVPANQAPAVNAGAQQSGTAG